MNSERAKSIVKNAESQLVNERIRLINSQLTALRDEYTRLTDWVKCGLSAELADTVFGKVSELRDKWVVNLSSTELSSQHKNVLARGLNFAIVSCPKRNLL